MHRKKFIYIYVYYEYIVIHLIVVMCSCFVSMEALVRRRTFVSSKETMMLFFTCWSISMNTQIVIKIFVPLLQWAHRSRYSQKLKVHLLQRRISLFRVQKDMQVVCGLTLFFSKVCVYHYMDELICLDWICMLLFILYPTYLDAENASTSTHRCI
jgi:hypothetical protein